MSIIVYKSTEAEYKRPFGAVKTGENITFNTKVQRDNMIKNVRFVYHSPEKWQSEDMKIIDVQDAYNIYSITKAFELPDIYYYHFEIDTAAGTQFCGVINGEAAVGDGLPEWQLTVYDKEYDTPDWAKGGIMYHIFPDRFCRDESYHLPPAKNSRMVRSDWRGAPQSFHDTPDFRSNDFFCGNLSGVISRLPYLKSLGVTMVYMNPIFESAENHRYSTGDYYKIDPFFGTEEIYKEFTDRCSELGIGVILDGVFSHTGADSIYFNKYDHYDSIGAYNSKISPYINWFTFNEYPEVYESWWGFKNLPNVNEAEPSYMDYIDGVLTYWQQRGTKGWRLDVVDELPDVFINRLRKTIKNADKDALLIGEVWEDASNKESYGVKRQYLLGKQLDSVMNYPWRTAIIDYVLYRDVMLFKNRIMSIAENYPPPALSCLMNSLSTHDTVRIINVLGVERHVEQEDKGKYKLTSEEYERGKMRQKQAAFLQFTLPGIPSIYYGEEVGLAGFEDPYCRMGYPYGDEDMELLEYYKDLSKARTDNLESFKGSFEFVSAQEGSFVFKREELICAINLGSGDMRLPEDARRAVFSSGLREDLMSLASGGYGIFSRVKSDIDIAAI